MTQRANFHLVYAGIVPLKKEIKNDIDSNKILSSTNPVQQTNVQVVTRIPSPKTEFNFDDLKSNKDVQLAIADSTSFNDTFEDSRASSVASIHQITEALRRKSLISEPRRAIEHLLSVGSCRFYVLFIAILIFLIITIIMIKF